MKPNLAHLPRFVPYLLVLTLGVTYVVVRSDPTLTAEWSALPTEAPLVLYLFALLKAPLKQRWWSTPIALAPLALIYVGHDAYYLAWGGVPSFSDTALLADLFTVISPLQGLLIATAVLMPLVAWIASIDRSRRFELRRNLWLLAPALLFLFGVLLLPGATYAAMDRLTGDSEWSDRRTAERSGRIYAALMREARRGSFSSGVDSFVPLEQSTLRLKPDEIAQIDHRNVHVIVMESFVDLRLLRGVTFSQPPFSPAFAAWVDPFISSSMSPVFGGETARAEFEVLCGVPSLRLYGLEFLGFSGAKTYCLPTILGDAGYRTVLSFPHGPVFFNTRHAYPGLGFDQRIFADRFSKPGEESIVLGDQDYLFDGDFLPQNLAKVRALVKAGRPFLNYVMTMYGHWPFDVDTSTRPLEVKVSPHDDDLQKIANQMLRRTEALDAFVRGVIEADPHSIIVLVADHLPSLPNGISDYARLGYQSRRKLPASQRELGPYENFLLVFVDGAPIKLPPMRHFDLSHWVLDRLSHGAHCKAHRCDFGQLPIRRDHYVDAYRTILGLAAKDL